ncbi:glyoxalase superfamily protein [Marinicella meishanensis]|uniref:glyoxalase superfamily protein n=1 Tax=Marinicella meishanensis TaxID=2873263 RepID=UPI001CC03C1D|nr:glyoxalase superfamily protein [Marinicella sp. NBU2979]
MKESVGFNWVTPILCVDNVANSLKHYEQVLGFEVSWSWSDETSFEQPDHPTFACVCRGHVSVFLCEQDQGKPGAWMFLNVENMADFEAIHEEYKKSGANIIEGPEDYSWGMREMLVADLDDNRFRIGCPLGSV